MEQPNYYSVIPASVRYDKRLKANEKLLYSEITSLANSKGFCYASNTYFAELYDVKPKAISAWINHLKECRYLNIEIDKEKGNTRKIYISDLSFKEGIPIPQKEDTPIPQKREHNNTSINNKYNKIFQLWNSLKICTHKKLTDDMTKAIDKATKQVGFESLLLAIQRYGQAYYDKQFYYNNKWALLNFLKQKNGYSNWLDDGQIWINYKPSVEPEKPKPNRTVPTADETEQQLQAIWGDEL